MSAHETSDELRARLNELYEADQRMWEGHRGSRFEYQVRIAWPTIEALLARLTIVKEENDELHEDLVRMMQERNAAIARLTAAEADADRLRSGLRYTLAWFDASTLAEFRRDASGQSLYDEVAVLRERPQ
jgi:hypothetical protein